MFIPVGGRGGIRTHGTYY